MEIEDLAARQCGALSARQALASLTPGALRWQVASGRWQRPARGLLVTHSGPIPRETWLWLVLLAAGPDAVLAGPTAAALAGLRGYEDDRIHVLVAPGRQVTALAGRGPGTVVHRSTSLPAQDVAARLPRRTTPARSVVDAAGWARDGRRAAALVAAAVQQRLVRPEQVRAVVERLPTARRRRVVLATLSDVAGGSHSVAEIDLVRLCRRAGLPPPAQQVARADRTGRRRWLDANWPEWRLQVEVDGAAHIEVSAWWADMRRQNDAWISGERVLRFPAVMVRLDPTAVADQIRAALRAAGWPGPSELVS